MQIKRAFLEFSTKGRLDFIPLSEKLEELCRQYNIEKGVALLRTPHTTSALIVNEPDPTVLQDLRGLLEAILSLKESWQHTYEGIPNAQAHQIGILLGTSTWIFIENFSPALGTWQEIFFVEGVEPRKRRVEVVFIKEE